MEEERKIMPTRTLHAKSDLTQGSIWKHIFNIALPAMVGHMFNSLYNWIDTFWGAKISTEALAGFALTFPVFLFAIALGQCFAAGGMVLVSNALGEKDIEKARKYMMQSVLNSLAFGLALMVLILIFTRPILQLFGGEGEVLESGVTYLKVIAFGIPFLLLYFTLNIGLVSQGNTRFMRNILIMNAFINLGLDPLLLYGLNIGGVQIIPEMGIAGIALATVIVQALGAIIAWIKIQKDPIAHWRSDDTHKIKWPKFNMDDTKKILGLGAPTFLQIALASFGIALVNFFMARLYGGVAVAGYGIGLRIEQMALIPSLGFGMALSSLVGQNNGAKNYLRIRESFRKTILATAVLWLVAMLPVTLLGASISRIFTEDFKVTQISYFYLSFAFLAYMGYQILGASSGLMQGIKKPMLPIIFLLARQLVFPIFFIPLFAYVLDWGIYGIFMSVTVSVWISAIILLILTNKEIKNRIRSAEGLETEQKE